MFDWSTLEKSSIIQQIFELSSKICDQELTVEKFHEILSKFIKRKFPVKTTCGYDTKVKHYKVFVGGAYYSDLDENDKKCIEINFYYNPVDISFKISRRKFKSICDTIADTILHEVIHMRQYRRRAFKSLHNYASSARSTKVREEQSYLGCTDEIDAYGFNIACELLGKYKGDQQALTQHLNLDLKNCQKYGGSWKMYLKAFGHDHNHEIIKRLKKKIIRYIPRAVSGKPFKSRDWICH
jgi:hypothetical protein